jgi:carbonic anhydrase
MSCDIGNMPIDVVETNEKCKLTCFYKFDYPISSLNVTNKGDHLVFSYDAKSDVTYNNEEYSVQECRLYKPSLNSYNGSHYDGEFIIHHVSNTGKNLLVCIPIKTDNASSSSEVLFNKIIPYIPSENGDNVSININNYTLNHVIPKAGYYSYNGNLPYQPCTGNYDIILFDPNNAININSENMATIGSVIEALETSPKEANKDKLFYNKDGTQDNELISGDDIYIDCQAVGENGEPLNETTQSKDSDSKEYSFKINKKTKEYLTIGGYILGGVAGAYALYFIWNKISSSISRK